MLLALFFGGVWRWLIVAFYVYGLISTPVTLGQVLRMFWNAPEAERRNRELLEEGMRLESLRDAAEP